MRIAIISRHAPDPEGTQLERRLHRRLVEFATLNVELLLLTRYRPQDLEREPVALPKNVDLRRPFTHGTANEWVRALPLLIGFRPDSIHVIDDQLSPTAPSWLSWISAERLVPALKSLTRLKRVVVSSGDAFQASQRKILWPGCIVETRWLSGDPPKKTHPRLSPNGFHILLDGTRKSRPSWLHDVEQLLLLANSQGQPLDFYFECNRLDLTKSEREQLASLERRVAQDRRALGARLHLGPLESSPQFDAILLAGLQKDALSEAATRWPCHPKIITDLEGLMIESDLTFVVVPDAGWHAFAIHRALQQESLQETWNLIADKSPEREADAINNEISRLHFSALAQSGA